MNATAPRAPLGPESQPRAAGALLITPPVADGERFVVHHPEAGTYLKLGAGAHTILRALDGHRTLTQVARETGAAVTVDAVVALAGSFAAHGLLETTAASTDGWDNALATERHRVRRTGITSVQLTLFDPGSWFDRVPRLARAVSGPALWLSALVGLLLAIAGVAASPHRIFSSVSTPVGAGPLYLALLALVPTMFLHELAHAAVAWRHGARARRLGVMLFYLAPAMFCDVSDCWRLPRRGQRVQVAGAGLALQAAVSGAALGAAGLASGSLPAPVVATLAIYGLANALLGLVNLAPFVRLDGYLALMSALDISHLRAKAIADLRAALGHRLLGLPARPPVLARRGPALAYGAACCAFPLVLLAFGLVRGNHLMLSLGATGALLWLAALGAIAATLGSRAAGGMRTVRRLVAAGELSPRRALTAGVTVAAVVTALAAAVTVPSHEAAGFRVAAGRVQLLIPARSSDSPTPGTRVTLRAPGLLFSSRLAGARVLGGPPVHLHDVVIPGPLTAIAQRGDATAIPVQPDGPVGRDSGVASLPGPRRTAGGWLIHTYLTPALALLGL